MAIKDIPNMPKTDKEMEERLNIPPGSMGRMGELTETLFATAKEHDKNVIVLGGGEKVEAKQTVLHLVVIMVKESDRRVVGDTFIEYFPIVEDTDAARDAAFKQISMQLVKMAADWDAVTDMDLNTLGNPLFELEQKREVLDKEVGDGIIWFNQFSGPELTMVMAQMGGLTPTPNLRGLGRDQFKPRETGEA